LIFYNNTYYLKLIEPINSSIIIDYLKTLFDEFGINVSCSPGIDGILNEYGKIIWKKNAIIRCIHCFV
jgi:negative regulator of genetic competence, sporulation and motility